MDCTALAPFLAAACPVPEGPPVTALSPGVVVGGWVQHPLRLGTAALRERGAREVRLPGRERSRPARAVSLTRLLEEAAPAFAQPGDAQRMAVVAEAATGHRVLFSWNELFNSPLGAGVLLAFDDPAAPLPAGDGPFALLSLHDHAPAARFVRQLAMVELVRLW